MTRDYAFTPNRAKLLSAENSEIFYQFNYMLSFLVSEAVMPHVGIFIAKESRSP